MTSHSSCRVLLVEDHAAVAEMMRQMLDILGFEAVVCGSVQDAVAVPRETYDLVLCDYRLPDGDAVTFLDALPDPPHVPVVLLSGFGVEDLTDDVTDRFAACLQKPVDMAELDTQLRRLCATS